MSEILPPKITPSLIKYRGEALPTKNCAKKRCVEDFYSQNCTRSTFNVTSSTPQSYVV